MRHVPIAQFKDKMSEIMAAAEAGEDVVITRHGRDYMKLVPVEEDRMARQRAAIAGLLELREELRAKGVRVSPEEIIAWKNEGRR
ncbi:type II toxin-antitoxin system Phd/YefM family antitoxin [Sphingomonas sp.]|uniref:type II toxin-antitoxin system Phd/YefM family antitoxin n=1 Tax=Sphingomonas sp. TaxID=28214 RepID=UPI0033422AD4